MLKDFTKIKEKGVKNCEEQIQPIHLLELFGGIGAPRRALENVISKRVQESNPGANKRELRRLAADRIKSIDYVEVLPYAVQAYNQMFDLSNRPQDIRLWNMNVDVLVHGSPCFTAETLVLTKKGYKNINDLKIGDYVLTRNNTYEKVVKVFDNGKRDIVKVVSTNVDEIKTTVNHRFWVRTKYNSWPKAEDGKHRWKRQFTTPQWKIAGELTRNDFVGYAINQNEIIPKWEGVECHRGHNTYIKKNLDVTDEGLWYMIGRYLGDGWTRRRNDRNGRISGLIICCGKNNVEDFKSKIPKNLPYTLVHDVTTDKFQFSNRELAMFCEQFGHGAANKSIPGFVFDMPVNLIKSLIAGYFESDGCKTNRNSNKVSSISKNLIYGIGQLIAKAYNIPFSIYKTKRPKTSMIEGRTVNQHDTYELKYIAEGDTNKRESFYEDGYMWYPIRKVEQLKEQETVYDIEVENEHSFTANGLIVHNCQDFSREGKNDINSGRSVLYERTLQILDPHPADGYPELTRQPKVVIWENVPNMAYSHQEILGHYLKTMESYGYTNTFCGSKKYVEKGGYVSERSIMVDHMIDASEYGIPQARERFFCVSVLNDLADKYGSFAMPSPVAEDKRYTLKQFLDLTADMDKNCFTDTELAITKKVGDQWFVKQAVKGDFGAGTGYVPVNEYQRVDFAFPNSKNRRGRVGDYASTLTTSPRQGVLIGDKFRMFTAKEKLRLMGFRDSDYENMVKSGLTDKQISLLAGNSICVPVLEHIFNAVFEQYPEMEKYTKEERAEKLSA